MYFLAKIYFLWNLFFIFVKVFSFVCVIFQNKEGRLRGCVRCALRRVLVVCGVCGCVGCVWGVGVGVGACIGVCCGVCWGLSGVGVGAGCRRVTLAALLSGYLGKSGHLPRS